MTEIDITAGRLRRALGPGSATAVLEPAAVQMDAIHDVAPPLVGIWLDVRDRSDAVRASGEREVLTAGVGVHTEPGQ
jgi:hypothetical protein